jgi:hypothetical protein
MITGIAQTVARYIALPLIASVGRDCQTHLCNGGL